MPDEPTASSSRPRPGADAPTSPPDRELTWRGLVALLAVTVAGAVVVATWDRYVLLVAGEVVPGWLLSAVLVVGALLVRRSATPRGTDPACAAVCWPLTAAAVVVLVVSGVSALSTSATGGYVALEPRGPGGCRVVVHETSFLLAGSGAVYLAGGSTGIGAKVGTYRSDDGGRPASSGAYDLRWDGSGGALSLGGAPGAEVVEQVVAPLTCSR